MKVIEGLKGAIQNLGYHQFGQCNICGKLTVFVCIDATVARNNMYCLFCRSSSRKRHVAKLVINQVINKEKYENKFSIADILKTQPVNQVNIYNADINDAFYKVLHHSDSYICSSFYPEVQPGTEIEKGVFCQDLESLTFANESFDVVITEDIFEHIRYPKKGFQEIHRVLKVGGYHIFTVPCNFDQPTIVRVDTSGGEDINLLPPEYHGDRIRGKILAYRTFGIDIFEVLKSIGFETKVDFSNYLDKKFGIVDSYVFCSKRLE
jgi:SAM-dependent methyltransferase